LPEQSEAGGEQLELACAPCARTHFLVRCCSLYAARTAGAAACQQELRPMRAGRLIADSQLSTLDDGLVSSCASCADVASLG
jgi:hypothetical protein